MSRSTVRGTGAGRVARLGAAAALGYAAGLVPSAQLAARAAGAGDISRLGTGNPGAANAIATIGPGWGYAVLAADIVKAAAASTAGRRIAGDLGSHVGAVASVAGHCYPATRGFAGGKGVACSVGQCATTFPAYVLPDLALAGLTGALPWWKARAHTATVVSTVAWTGAATLWWRRGWPNLWGPPPTAALPLAAAATSAMILQRFGADRARVAAVLAERDAPPPDAQPADTQPVDPAHPEPPT